MNQPLKGQRVDLLHAEKDLLVAVMGSMGQSTRAIMKRTGFTQGQITYRLGKGGVKRAEYRDGTSKVARAIFAQNRALAEPIVLAQLRKKLGAEYGER